MVHCTCSEAGLATAVKTPTQARPNEKTLVEIDTVPLIGETPHQTLQNWLTPNPLSYVRNHFRTQPLRYPRSRNVLLATDRRWVRLEARSA